MITDLTHLDWQPVILLKVVRMPFGGIGGLSLKRAYLALHDGQLLYADWTLEASERSEPLVCATGWTCTSPLEYPARLQGKGAHLIPSGTWVLLYSDYLYSLYGRAADFLIHLIKCIDSQPTADATVTLLVRLSQIL
ncbi:MAG: hypothetical protein IAE80_09205 [Anaerolinea sp.]|nr:hypothetical protein [Anaerolinea sp.]